MQSILGQMQLSLQLHQNTHPNIPPTDDVLCLGWSHILIPTNYSTINSSTNTSFLGCYSYKNFPCTSLYLIGHWNQMIWSFWWAHRLRSIWFGIIPIGFSVVAIGFGVVNVPWSVSNLKKIYEIFRTVSDFENKIKFTSYFVPLKGTTWQDANLSCQCQCQML